MNKKFERCQKGFLWCFCLIPAAMVLCTTAARGEGRGEEPAGYAYYEEERSGEYDDRSYYEEEWRSDPAVYDESPEEWDREPAEYVDRADGDVRPTVIVESEDAPIEVPMSRGEVIRKLADYSKRFVEERGVEAAAEALWELQEGRREFFDEEFIPPEELADWLAYAPPDEISEVFCSDSKLMDQTAYALFVKQYGIEFHYRLESFIDAAPNQPKQDDILKSADLAGVIARLLCYPDGLLEYIGHSQPKLVVNLYAPGVVLKISGKTVGGYAAGEVVHIGPGKAGATVHETAHAIEDIAVNDNQNDPNNPLSGCKAEFDQRFPIPPKWKGVVTYANYPFGVPIKEAPPGFTDLYAMINVSENFAQACTYYVKEPDYFLRRAYAQGWDEEIELCLKYRFAFEWVYMYEYFSDLLPPQTALLSLRAVDKGDGDGRIEPGESFSLDMSLVPLDDYPDIDHLQCVPWVVNPKVVSVATSVFVNGLQKGKRYDFSKAFDFYLHPIFQGETNRTFMLRAYGPKGVIDEFCFTSVPLNEQGYLWGVTQASTGGGGWAQAPKLVRLTSTMKELETLPLPKSLLDALYKYDYSGLLYDAKTDCFWAPGPWASGFALRIPRQTLGQFDVIPIDPEKKVKADEIVEMKLNPLDGALWLRTDVAMVVRLKITPSGAGQAPTVERLIVNPPAVTGVTWDWGTTEDMAIDPTSGKVWLVSEKGLLRLSPTGDKVELVVGGLSKADLVAASAGGGCWVSSRTNTKDTLTKITGAGKVQFIQPTDYLFNELMLHPVGKSLWALVREKCYEDTKLVHLSAAGLPQSTWKADKYSETIVPCLTDGTVFVSFKYDQESAKRYQLYGNPLYSRTLNPTEYFPIGYQPAP